MFDHVEILSLIYTKLFFMAQKGILTFFVCLFTFCGQPFEIINSTSQKYYAGRQESGGGIKYEVELVAIKPSKKLKFESLVANGKESKIKIQNSNEQFVKEFSKGDTLVLYATISYTPEELSELNNEKNAEVMLNYLLKKKEGTALLTPKLKQTKHYK